MVAPWLDAGYRAITVDLQPAEGAHPNRIHIQADILALADDFAAQFDPHAVFAFPSCTNLAVSGARWFRDKGLSGLIVGLQLVDKCRCICEANGGRWMLENPVSTIASYWRDPDHVFDPNDYGDPYTKKTCIWVGGGFIIPPIIRPATLQADLLGEQPTWVEPTLGSMIHRMAPSEDRGDRRSITPPGFSVAVCKANLHIEERQMA